MDLEYEARISGLQTCVKFFDVHEWAKTQPFKPMKDVAGELMRFIV